MSMETTKTTRPTSELVELVQGFLNDFEIHVTTCPILHKGEREGMGGVFPVQGDTIEEHIAAELEVFHSQDQWFERSHWTICDCCATDVKVVEVPGPVAEAEKVATDRTAELAQEELDRREWNRKNKNNRAEAAAPWLFKASKVDLLALIG